MASTGRGTESRALQHAGWAGAVAVVLLIAGLSISATASIEEPGLSDAAVAGRLDDGARQAAAGVGLPLLCLGLALMLWFASGLRRLLDRQSGGDPLTHTIVPAVALLGGLMITSISLGVASAVGASRGEFTPDPATARVLSTAGGLIGFSGLVGGAVLIAVTTRIAHRARALPTWVAWLSYAVAVLCLSGFWGADAAAAPFWLGVIGAVVGLLRAARARD
ncbi:hypothetical protein KOI35_04615 [Actinoplanes bogorensis]|uniref:DUF4386 family protein n=1 Tax=Paractinoplanes bogorensis TaxID=1610840 RepID=A0ABS5YH27_9ACTN|nr:hypothetical protein [Actinoplanes bogorensis]MBU2662784.1 hypothetical protein [Actinoplanes bogorensis]